jgi:hypothetical protein
MAVQLEGLENGEFVILTEDSFHAVDQAGQQVQLCPVTLHLTNHHIFAKPQLATQIQIQEKLVVFSITSFGHAVVNDLDVLEIYCELPRPALRLFIPDDTRRRVFREVVDDLRGSSDRSALSLRRSVQDAESLQNFYENYKGLPPEPVELEAAPPQDPRARERATVLALRAVLRPINIVANLIEISPRLAFVAIFCSAAAVSLVCRFVSFGALAGAVGVLLAIVFGVRKVVGPVRSGPPPIAAEDVEISVRDFVATTNSLSELLDKRIFWGQPELTLNLAAFALCILVLFVLFDPAFLLVLSLIGLAFFERWNPIGAGSISTALSKLILW